MILTCPNCGTQYVVKDGAIPPEGRQVRCAACKHSWHQDAEPAAPAPPDTDVDRSAEAAEIRDESAEDESLAGATLIEPRSGPEAEERAYDETLIADDDAERGPGAAGAGAEAGLAGADAAEPAQPQSEPAEAQPETVAEDWKEPPHGEASSDAFSPFADNGEVEPRRRSPLTGILVIAAAVIVIAALFWFFAPADLKARLGLAAAGSSPLALVTTHMDRQRLESGNELLTVTGRVINPTGKEQDVPPLQAQLRDRAGKVVYRWTIAPPARSLPAGASASFNSAEVNVLPGAGQFTITLGDPRHP